MHLVVPENLSLVFLPPYSPELNPIERLWLHQVTPEQLNLGMLFPPRICWRSKFRPPRA